MKKYTKELITDLEQQLETIHLESNDPVEYSEKAMKYIVSILEKLKSFFIQYTFEKKSDEIEFFREIKPQFASKLIYYNTIYGIETKKPFGSSKAQRKFYNTELTKLKDFFDENSHFYEYIRTGNHYLDKKYFIRGKHDIKLSIDSFYFSGRPAIFYLS